MSPMPGVNPVVVAIKSLFAPGPAEPQRVSMATVKPDDADLGKYLKWWNAAKEARTAVERQWQINLNYYYGNQYIGYSDALMSVQELKAPPWRTRVTDNVIFAKVRGKISRSISKPEAQVIPDTSGDDDIERAKAKEAVLNHLYHTNKFPMLQMQAQFWGTTCGNAFFDVQWDKTAGEMWVDKSGEYASGEVTVKVRSPYEVFFDPSAKEGWGRWCWTADLIDKDEVKQRFGLDDVKADGVGWDADKLRAMMLGWFDSKGSPVLSTKQQLDDMVLVRTLYRFKSASCPKPRKVVIINDKIVSDEPLEWFGLVNYRNLLLLDSPYGDTEVRHAIPRQKSRNRTLSSIEEYLRVMAKGKWLTHKGNKLTSEQIDSEHGEKIVWDGPGPPPQPVTAGSLPADVWNHLSLNDASMDNIFSDHPASQGQAPAGIKAAAAINFLIEEDERQHGPSLIMYESALTETYKLMLDCAAKNYTDDHKIQVLGEDQRPNVRSIKKSDLGGTNRVYIGVGGSLPKNKTVRNELVRRNYAEGLYGNPQDPEVRKKVLKMLDAGVVEEVYGDSQLDEAKQEREIDQMKAGATAQVLEVIYPSDVDNHQIHIRVLESFMKTQEYDQLPVPVQELMRAHRSIHIELLMASMPQPPAMPGQPAGPSGPTPPGGESGASGPQGAVEVMQGLTPPSGTPDGMGVGG